MTVRRPFLENSTQPSESRVVKTTTKLSEDCDNHTQTLLATGESVLSSKKRDVSRPIYRYQAKGSGVIKRVNSVVKADVHKQLPVVEEVEEQ